MERALKVCLQHGHAPAGSVGSPEDITAFLLIDRTLDKLACCCKEFTVSREEKADKLLRHVRAWFRNEACNWTFSDRIDDDIDVLDADNLFELFELEKSLLAEWEIEVVIERFADLTYDIRNDLGPYYALDFAHSFMEMLRARRAPEDYDLPFKIMEAAMQETLPEGMAMSKNSEWMCDIEYLSLRLDEEVKLKLRMLRTAEDLFVPASLEGTLL